MNKNDAAWCSYPKVYNIGHPTIAALLDGDVVVQEKVDGSQFSFGVFDGELRARSKGKQLVIDAPEQMFTMAVETARSLAPLLRDGWAYRGEYLQRPRHNGLHYDRTPRQHVILFDVQIGEGAFLGPDALRDEAERIGLECVPSLWRGDGGALKQGSIDEWCNTTSVLGGQRMEGVVIKNYARFAADGKALMGKHVREDFKEVQRKTWKRENPKSGDILERLCDAFRTPARWDKAVQHLRERGDLHGDPRDIGPLMKEVQADIAEENIQEIKDELWRWAKQHIMRASVKGLPDWYKHRLVGQQFNGEGSEQ